MNTPKKVYAIQHNVTKRIYIGSSSDVNARYWSHIHLLRAGKHNVEDMQADFDKYGEDFSLFILEEITSFTDRALEYDWMEKYQSHIRGKGYNYKDRAVTKRRKGMEPLKDGLPEAWPEEEVPSHG